MTKTKKPVDKKHAPSLAQRRKMFEKATKLHEILKVALQELRAVEKDKRFVVDMNHWVQGDGIENDDFELEIRPPSEKTPCSACLAGSVMVGLYPKVCAQLGWDATPDDFSEIDEVEAKLDALNALRGGCVDEAHSRLYPKWDSFPELGLDRKVIDYHDNRVQWWKDMRKLLSDLKKADL